MTKWNGKKNTNTKAPQNYQNCIILKALKHQSYKKKKLKQLPEIYITNQQDIKTKQEILVFFLHLKQKNVNQTIRNKA